MRIRKATLKDFNTLYKIGKSIPELKVSNNEVFMKSEDFKFAIQNKKGVFLIAEDEGKPIGFAYSYIEAPTYACMVYFAVVKRHRGKGVASKLTHRIEKWLKAKGVKSTYGLATNPSMMKILRHWGYKEGKKLTWMDKNLR